MFDDLYSRERSYSLSQLLQRPQLPDSGPGAFSGFGGALADSVPNAALTAGSAWSALLDAYGKAAAYRDAPTVAMIHGEPPPDMDKLKRETIDQMGNSETARALREQAKKFAPDPASVGVAGQVVHGLVSSLTKAVAYTATTGPAAPVVFGGDMGINRAQELSDQGVDGGTAAAAGLVTGVVSASGLKLPPALGATRLQSAAIGATINPALGIAERGTIHALLEHANYPQIAAQYRPLDPTQLTVEALAGAAFGGIFHTAKTHEGGTLTPDEHAATLTMNEVRTRDADTLARPGDITAADHAHDAQLLARGQLDAGQQVSVAHGLALDESKVAEVTARIGDDIDPALREEIAARSEALPRSPDLSPEHRAIETDAYRRILQDPARMIDEYFAEHGNVIDPDNVKRMFPQFAADPKLAAAVHEPSSFLSKLIFAEALRRNEGNPVVFTAGGGGSGKTEAMPIALATTGKGSDGLVFDSTLSSFQSAVKKIDSALASGSPVGIIYTNRHIDGAFQFAMGRDRVVPAKTLATAHVGASDTIRALAEHYKGNPNVEILVVNNHGDRAAMHIGSIEDVFKYEYNQVERRLYDLAKQALDSGAITRERYEALIRQDHEGKAGGGYREVQQGQPGQDLGRSGERARSRAEVQRSDLQGEEGGLSAESSRPGSPAGETTPEISSAQQILAEHPDLTIRLDDGTDVRASDALREADAVITQASTEANAFRAAVACATRFDS